MEKLDLLAVALGLACLAGINLYLTVFATGLAIHFHWITLAPAYQSLPASSISSNFSQTKFRGLTLPGTPFTPLFVPLEALCSQSRCSVIRVRR